MNDSNAGSGSMLGSQAHASTPTEVAFASKWPKAMVWLTVMFLLIAAALKIFQEQLNELVNLDPGVANLALLGLPMIAWIGWLVWITIFSGWSATVRLLVLAVVGGVPLLAAICFQPVFDGDVAVIGFEYRFSTTERSYGESSSVVADSDAIEPLETTEFDFPQFLGPNRNATITNVRLASDWKTQPPEIQWKIPVGDAWSGVVVVGERAFTQEQRGELECVTCYDVESGKQHWCYSAQRRHEDLSAMGRVGPRATPTVQDGRLYAVSGTGVLDCLSALTGNLIWSVDVPAQVGIEQTQRTNSNGYAYTQETSTLTWGRATSPLIDGEVVIVPAGGPANGPAVTLMAFDLKTGEERWRAGDRACSYGSPARVTILGEPQIVLVVENGVVGCDPLTGQELWHQDFPGNSDSNASCSQVTPLNDATLLLSKGYGIGAEVIQLAKQDGVWSSTSVKSNPRVVKTKFTNPVVFGGHAYSLSDGFLECTQIPALRRRWKKRGRFGHGQLLLVGDLLLVHSQFGQLSLVRATPDRFEPLAMVATIDGTCWNTLCLSGDRLIVRSEREAAMIRLPLQPEAQVGLSQVGP